MKNIVKLLFLVAMVSGMIVSGCSTPNFERKEIRQTITEIPETWSDISDNQQVEANWVAQFNDPLLTKLVLEAQQYNKELNGLFATINQARALAKQAHASLLPNINLSTSGNRELEEGFRTHSKNVALESSWEIDLWGRLRSQSLSAQASVKAVEADYLFAQYSLAASVAQAYFTAIDAEIQTQTIKKSEVNLQRIYDVVALQAQQGFASQQDLAVSKSDLAVVRSQLAGAENARRDTLRSLELLLGRYPSADVQLRSQLPQAPSIPSAGLPSQLLERRPDLIAAEQRIAAAFYNVNVAKAAQLPNVSLTALGGGNSSGFSNILSDGNQSWSVGAGLLAPIFQGGALKAQFDNANAEQQEAIAAYGQAALNAFNEVESSLDLATVYMEQEKQLNNAYQTANEAYRIAKIRFDEGDLSLIDLLSIQQRVFDRETDLISTKRGILEQRVNLYLALGGAWN